ncbi:L-threonylcarbamoyladenylate synthase [Solirubrobacter ginsenosidimutans]|uniref:L-threonylcarbamoyladenylate synthase n=1 Tax=Solirubrobacter ginsenosidimutans TaxID=490573 RepID=A0A9X3MXU7_9ACTN|nr:L-threonylcarbamoyladenylate synthase [Solirubrobacter ginsenosidimutans]MDA0164562.1 L-threonylcarbamoyladenylate synthase [Solirubrobacter ginsenosidimutans]
MLRAALNDLELEKLVEQTAEVMRNGGVALVPTDTVYGLACDPRHPGAAAEIFRLKDRPADVRLPVIVTGLAQAATLGVEWTAAAAALADAFWPGPLTIAVGVDPEATDWLSGRVEIGLRAPASDLALGLAETLGPFLMTSANRHRHDTPGTLDEALGELAGQPGIAVDGGPLSVVSSTLVNVNLPVPIIEREAAVPAADVERVLARVSA